MEQGKDKSSDAVEVSIRRNLFIIGADGRPKLIVGRCRRCHLIFYPKEPVCPICIEVGTLETIEIDGKGKIISFTRVMRGLPGYDSPYTLACIELDAGPSLIAQLQDWQEVELKLHMPVELVIGRIKTEKNGNIIVGPKFKPLPM